MSESNLKLRVFLCHASQDKPVVRELYRRLIDEDWIDPWLDEEKLLPGQDWDLEIEKAVESADVVVVCLSSESVSKEGYIQRELRYAMDIALEKPDNTIFIVPLRLDSCELPRRLRTLQWVDYFPIDRRDWAYARLLQALKLRGGQKNIRPMTRELPRPSRQGKSVPNNVNGPSTLTKMRLAVSKRPDAVATISLLAFFLMLSFEFLGGSSDGLKVLIAVSGLVGGFNVWRKRTIPAGKYFLSSIALFVVVHVILIFNDNIGWELDWLEPVFGLAALLQSFMIIISMPKIKVLTTTSATFMAIYMFLISILLGLNGFGVYPSWPQIPTAVAGILSAVLLLREA